MRDSDSPSKAIGFFLALLLASAIAASLLLIYRHHYMSAAMLFGLAVFVVGRVGVRPSTLAYRQVLASTVEAAQEALYPTEAHRVRRQLAQYRHSRKVEKIASQALDQLKELEHQYHTFEKRLAARWDSEDPLYHRLHGIGHGVFTRVLEGFHESVSLIGQLVDEPREDAVERLEALFLAHADIMTRYDEVNALLESEPPGSTEPGTALIQAITALEAQGESRKHSAS